MKKYFFGLIAIAAAIALSAFTGKFATLTVLLTSDPTSSGIVNDPSNWSDAGTIYGACTTTPEDLACTIKLETTTMPLYVHVDGNGDIVLNDETYARANFNFFNQNGSPRFFQITESFVNPRYIINTITGVKFVQLSISDPLIPVTDSKNIQKQQNLSSGVDVAYFNAKKI